MWLYLDSLDRRGNWTHLDSISVRAPRRTYPKPRNTYPLQTPYIFVTIRRLSPPIHHTMAATASTSELKLDPKYDQYDFPTISPTAQNGHPGHTTPEQDAQVFQLRTALEQAGYTKNLDTLTLVRLLMLVAPSYTPPCMLIAT